MKTSHTPGPWKVNENGWVIGANGETIVSHHPMTHLDETAQADARLIAAAPELLDILKEIIIQEVDSAKHGIYGITSSLVAQAQDAIAKATQP